MKANELRVGNKLLRHNKIIEVEEIGVKHKGDLNYYIRCKGDNCGYWINQFEPISLTEEILLKCGFEKIREFFTISYEFDVFKDNKGYYTHINCGNLYISSLHQLQNLYFALIGEELTVNL